MAEFDDLKTGAERIRDEVADRANTALRIGTWNLGILNWVKSVFDKLFTSTITAETNTSPSNKAVSDALSKKADLGGSTKNLLQVDEKTGVPFSKRIIEFKRFSGTVNANTGIITPTAVSNFYTAINVIGYSKVRYQAFITGSVNGVAFLDANGNFISGKAYTGIKPGEWITLDVPLNAVTFLFCYQTDSFATENGNPIFSYVELQTSSSITTFKRIELTTPEYCIQNPTEITDLVWHENEAWNIDGTHKTAENWRRSDPYPIPLNYANDWYVTISGRLLGLANILYLDAAGKVIAYIEDNPTIVQGRITRPFGATSVAFTTVVKSLVVDSKNNVILPFKLESAQAYSFNENLISINKRIDEISFENRTVYSQDFKNSLSDFTTNTWTVANGKLNSPASYALAFWNKNTTNEQVNTRIRVAVNDITSRFAIIRKTRESIGGTVGEVNCQTRKLNFYESWDGVNNPSTTSIIKSIDIPFSFISGHEYIIELFKQVELSTLRITDALTFQSVDLVYSQQTDANLTGMGVGRQWGNPGIAFFSGSISISKIEYISLITRRPSVLSIGDSFSEMWNLTPTMQSKWNSLLKAEINDVVIAGRGGATSSSILSRLDADLLSFKPRYVILLIGANDSVYNTWLANMTTVITKIKSIGAIPILGTIAPRYDRMAFINQANAYIRGSDIRYIDFNRVLTANNDGVTWNPDLVQADMIHPNALGFQAMYNRVKVDLPEIFDSNN